MHTQVRTSLSPPSWELIRCIFLLQTVPQNFSHIRQRHKQRFRAGGAKLLLSATHSLPPVSLSLGHRKLSTYYVPTLLTDVG